MLLGVFGETSQIITQALRLLGHEAYSLDIEEAQINSAWHIQGDYHSKLSMPWDGIIAHPVCTRLSNCGNKFYKGKSMRPEYFEQRENAINAFRVFQSLQVAHIPKIAIENPQPSGYVMERIGRYDQKIQPYWFGDKETKGICWWLKGLPKLYETNNVKEEMMKLPYKQRARVHSEPPGPDRQKNRSDFSFFPNTITAIVAQWFPTHQPL